MTGGAGFIGSHLVRQLVAANHAVIVLEKPGASVSHLPQEQIEIVFADIRDDTAVARATVDCHVVLHLAANPDLWACEPDDFEQVNHQGTRHMLELPEGLAPATSSTSPRNRFSRRRRVRT